MANKLEAQRAKVAELEKVAAEKLVVVTDFENNLFELQKEANAKREDYKNARKALSDAEAEMFKLTQNQK
jgi:hypothetical protein